MLPAIRLSAAQRIREPCISRILMHGSLFLCQTASGIRFMRQQIAGTTPTRLRSFHTASGMRSHVTLCLGGRRNRRLKSWFWKTSSKPNMRSHFFGCYYIPSEYVMTPPSLVQQGLRRFEENRKTCPVFSPLRGFPVVHTVAWFLLFVKQKRRPISSERGRR